MANQYINAMTALWNSAGTTYSAVKMNVTNAASAADSMLLQLQVGAVDKFSVSKAGALTVAGAITAVGLTTSGAQVPTTNDGAALGSSALAWSDLYLASGGVINWNAGDVTITHATDQLLFAGAASGYSFDATIKPAANDGSALGISGTAWSDAFFASGAVLDFAAGDITVTHAVETADPTPVAVTSLSNANPAVCTVAAGDIDKFFDGMTVTIAGAAGTGMTAANGSWVISSVGTPANTFTLTGVNTSAGTAPQTSGVTADPPAIPATLTIAGGDFRVATPGIHATSVATVGSTQTLRNKTLTSPILNTPTINAATITGIINGGTFTGSTLTSPTISNPTITGTINAATLSMSGNITAGGTITAAAFTNTAGHYYGNASYIVLQSLATAGICYLRPNNSATGQTTISSTGDMAVTGDVRSNGGLVTVYGSSAQMRIIPSAGNGHLWFYDASGTATRAILYTSGGAQGNLNMTVGSTNFVFEPNGQFNAPGAVYAGGSYHNTDGNIVGSVWLNFGYNDAYTAIYHRIEGRGQAWGTWGVNQCVTSSRMAGLVSPAHHPNNFATTQYSAYVLCGVGGAGNGAMVYHFRQPQLHIPNAGWFAAFVF